MFCFVLKKVCNLFCRLFFYVVSAEYLLSICQVTAKSIMIFLLCVFGFFLLLFRIIPNNKLFITLSLFYCDIKKNCYLRVLILES